MSRVIRAALGAAIIVFISAVGLTVANGLPAAQQMVPNGLEMFAVAFVVMYLFIKP